MLSLTSCVIVEITVFRFKLLVAVLVPAASVERYFPDMQAWVGGMYMSGVCIRELDL